MTPKRLAQLRRKVQESRYRLLKQAPRFAQPLRELRFVAVKPLHHVSTNGNTIFLDPDWLAKVSPEGLDFLLSHQLMHIAMGHIGRNALYKGARFHLACDIVVNSHLRKLGWTAEKLNGVGTLYHTTFFPVVEGSELTPEEAFPKIPMDPATLSDAARRRYMIDDEQFWGRKEDPENGILLLSPDDPIPEDLRLTPRRHAEASEREAGYCSQKFPQVPTEEGDELGEQRNRGLASDLNDRELEVIEAILDAAEWSQKLPPQESPVGSGAQPNWDAVTKEALKAVRSDRNRAEEHRREREADGRIWQKVNHTCLNWRKLLDQFLQVEVCDYSFLPPDRRFQEGDFFLPDFSDTQIVPLKLLFMVDTSGSIDDGLLSVVYTEIRSAIEQFHGSLTGLLGFFDSRVYHPVPFASVSDIRRIRPYGGGDTDFSCIFSACAQYFGDQNLSSLVIITDGRGDFPQESAAQGIPVLWLLTDPAIRPPWGSCAWLDRDDLT